MSDYTSRRPDAVSGSRSDADITNSGRESAFPLPVENIYKGITIRDYFAAQFAAGLSRSVLEDGAIVLKKASEMHKCTASEVMALMCYEFADAMLSAREEKK